MLASGSDLAKQDTRKRMAALLKQMQGSLPPQVRLAEGH